MKLTPGHVDLLRASAITDEVIEARGYWTATQKDELADLGFAEYQRLVPALVIPIWGLDGSIVCHQIRPDSPRLNEKGKPIKYESPDGAEIRLDVPLATSNALRSKGFKLTLWITEGAKKVDAAVSAGMLPVGLPGVWSWKNRTSRVTADVLPDLVSLVPYLPDRQIVLAFDADSISNPSVHEAMRQFGLWLEDNGAAVLYANLPEVKGDRKAGLDDFLAAGGTVEQLWNEHVLAELPLRKRPEQMFGKPGEKDGSEQKSNARRLVLTRASEIKSERVRWLWPQRMPLRGMTVVAGEKGLGKSMLTNAQLVAQLTRGKLDGELKGRPVDVLVVTAEDDWRAVVKPRLIAHSADLDRVHRVEVEDGDGQTTMTLPDDVGLIKAEIERLREEEGREVAMVVIDPIGAFLPSSINSHGDAPVRRALAPLAALADRQDIAVLVVMHLTKDEAKRLIHRVSGAGAFVNAARSVLAMMRDPEDPEGEQGLKRLILHVATNWGRYAPTLAAHIESKTVRTDDGSDESTGLLVIDGESTFSVDDAQKSRDEVGSEDVEDAIRAALIDEPDDGELKILTRPSGVIKQKVASELGCSRKTVERAGVRMAERGEMEIVPGGFPRTTTWTLVAETEPDEDHDEPVGTEQDAAVGTDPDTESVPTGANDGTEPNSGAQKGQTQNGRVLTEQTRIPEPKFGSPDSSRDTNGGPGPTVPAEPAVPTVPTGSDGRSDHFSTPWPMRTSRRSTPASMPTPTPEGRTPNGQ